MTEWIASALAGTPGADIVGLAEITEILGLSRQRVQQLKDSEDFPPVLKTITLGDIYVRADIERFASKQRGPGRPSKTEDHEPWMRPGLLAVNTMVQVLNRLGQKTSHDRKRPGVRIRQFDETTVSVHVDVSEFEATNLQRAKALREALEAAGYVVTAEAESPIIRVRKLADAWMPPRFYKKADGNYHAQCADGIGHKETYSLSRRQRGTTEEYWALTVSSGPAVADNEYAVQHSTKKAAQARALEIWKQRRQIEWEADQEIAVNDRAIEKGEAEKAEPDLPNWVKVGGKALWTRSHGGTSRKVVTIVKITPKGQIVLDNGDRFLPAHQRRDRVTGGVEYTKHEWTRAITTLSELKAKGN